MRLTERLWNRAARELVARGVPPRFTGYRYVRGVAPQWFDYEQVDPPTVSRVPLPCNISSRDELSRERGRWGMSFHDVPERPVAETFIATIPRCRIFTGVDEWGEPYYAILSDGRQVQVRGTGYNRRIHQNLVAHTPANVPSIPKAAWILEQWDRNYSHWVQWHMVKLALLQTRRPDARVILPSGSRIRPVIDRSLEMLGIRDAIDLPAAVVDVGELTVVGIDDYRASLLRALRNQLALTRDRKNPRRIFISRERAKWRRLDNEEEVWRILEPYGYERVAMEDLSFDAQVARVNGAAAVFGLHGSGFANLMFAAEGTHVIEIADMAFPNPQFYALASALDQPYWLLQGRGVGRQQPGYDDVSVELDDVKRIADQVEDRLTA